MRYLSGYVAAALYNYQKVYHPQYSSGSFSQFPSFGKRWTAVNHCQQDLVVTHIMKLTVVSYLQIDVSKLFRVARNNVARPWKIFEICWWINKISINLQETAGWVLWMATTRLSIWSAFRWQTIFILFTNQFFIAGIACSASWRCEQLPDIELKYIAVLLALAEYAATFPIAK